MNFSNTPILKKLGLFAVFMVCLTSLKATHIVGGSLTYTCLGNDNYEVQLTVYRDCFYADPLAFFDNPAYIGVFGQNNILVGNLRLPLLNNDSIPPVLNDPCLFVPADVCVHTTTYRGVINLPYRAGGYQLAYERCCRNETIQNIIDPLNAGAVFSTFIAETALLECNSSAKFTEWPPLFVCVNEPIDWDHSAVDVDGDSLVYSLCTPLSGGSQARPQPIPTNNPPYDHVIWNDPAYNLDNLLGGVPLTLDSKTGRLTAVPGVMGQFVVGVCVSEYRNGEKISETRRDFQYNVGECGMVESTIVAPTVQCEDLSVTFTNESLNADGYQWNFNDPNNPGATSTLAEPTYAYSEPGTYTIELIASTREVCTDTSYHTIFLQRNSMTADFEVDVQDCVNSSTIIVTDRSTDPISDPSQWTWSLSEDGAITQSSSLQNPEFTVSAPSSIELTLTTTSKNGCVDGSLKTFDTQINDPGDQIASNIEVCVGTETEINPTGAAGYIYEWEANPYFNNLSSINPSVILTEDAQLSVRITSVDGGCSSSKIVNLNVTDIPAINDIPDQLELCLGNSVQLNQTDYPNLDFSWSGSNLSNPNSDTPFASPTSSNVYSVVITESGMLSCSVNKEVNVVVNENPDDALALVEEQATICNGNAVSLNQNGDPRFDFTWNGVGFSGVTIFNPTVSPTSTTNYGVTVTDRLTGCTSEKSITVLVPADINLSAEGDRNICFNTETTLKAIGTGDLTYQWTSADGSIMSTESILLFSQSESEDIRLTARNPEGCSETILVEVEVGERISALENLPNSLLVCVDIPTPLSTTENNQYDFLWSPALHLDDATSSIPVFSSNETTAYKVEVTNPINGCKIEKSIEVIVPAEINLNVDGDRDICFDTETTLQASGTGNLTYQWMSADGSIMSTDSILLFSQNESEDIQLTARNPEGCSETVLVQVEVAERLTALDNLPDSVLVCENIPTSLSSNENNQFEFLWTPTANIDDATSSIPVFTSDQTTIYTVEAINPLNGCKVERSLRAVVPQKIDLNVTDDIMTCGDAEILLTASSANGESYNWIQTNGASIGTQSTVAVDPRTSAKYLVEVVDQFGCFVMDSVNVDFVGIQANIADDNLETCDDELQLTLTDVTANSSNTYIWGPSEAIISGETSSNPIILNASNDPITFNVTVTNDDGCVVQDQVTVRNKFDLSNLDVGRNACVDIELNLNPDFNSSYEYNWGPANLLDDPTAANPSYLPTMDQLFTVTVTDNDGCSTIREVQVSTVDLNDMVDIDIQADTILGGEETQLIVTSDPDFSYLWIPPTSLSSNTISNPIANPTETTNYNVMVTNSQGCVATKSITLNVLSSECNEPFVFFPNAFTPNGDGLNDVLRVRGNALSEVRFIIYDRWGERIFETNSIDGSWDGTYKGKLLPPDVYGYYLEAKCIFGGEYKKQGNVTLLD